MNIERINFMYIAALPAGVWGAIGFLGVLKRTIIGPPMETPGLVFAVLLTALFLGVALFLVRTGDQMQKRMDKEDGA